MADLSDPVWRDALSAGTIDLTAIDAGRQVAVYAPDEYYWTYDRNGEMISNLFSEGETITMVGSLRNAGNNSTEIVVEEVHFSGGGQKNSEFC